MKYSSLALATTLAFGTAPHTPVEAAQPQSKDAHLLPAIAIAFNILGTDFYMAQGANEQNARLNAKKECQKKSPNSSGCVDYAFFLRPSYERACVTFQIIPSKNNNTITHNVVESSERAYALKPQAFLCNDTPTIGSMGSLGVTENKDEPHKDKTVKANVLPTPTYSPIAAALNMDSREIYISLGKYGIEANKNAMTLCTQNRKELSDRCINIGSATSKDLKACLAVNNITKNGQNSIERKLYKTMEEIRAANPKNFLCNH